MVVDERARKRLHDALERVLGSDEAATMMEHLPPVGWADVATKRDLDQLRVATKRDLEELRVATKRDLEELRIATKRDFEGLRVATKHDLEQVEIGIKTDVMGLRAEMERLARRLVMWTSSMIVAMAGLAFAAARLL